MDEFKALGWKTVSYGAGAAATLIARKALAIAWARFGNSPPPEDTANRRVPWSQALVWAVATGVGMGVSRLIAMRSAATVWEAATNEPPPGQEQYAY